MKVVDKYGDYGYVGFFLVESFRTQHVAGASIRTLRHFCFSCRTLGMLVEKWLYDYLGKPELRVVGEVLTDVFQEKKVDWIKLGYGGADETDAAEARFAQRHQREFLDPATPVSGLGVPHDLTRIADRLQITGDDLVERRSLRARRFRQCRFAAAQAPYRRRWRQRRQPRWAGTGQAGA